MQNEAGFLRERLASLTGSEFHTSETTSAEGGIHLSLGSVSVNGVSREAYRLSIGGDGVSIQGSDPAGVFYGIQSLLAVVPLDVYMNRQQTISIGYLEIEDAPRFHHRSQHIDVSRNFQTKETLFRIIDILSFYKINHLLLHLTEDEGWRIEIDGLPELTGIGAKREHLGSPAEAGVHPAYGSGPMAYAPETFGSGYYSKQDFVEILNYAKARHVRVIPAVNFPGHARAAIKSMEARYQRLFAEGREEEAEMYRLIDPEDRSVYFSAQSFNDNVVSVARESTYRFYEKVVDEIARLYEQAGLKLEIFHTGGDEVPEGAWTLSPMAAALLETLPGIDDPKNLQIYFFRELNRRLAGKAIQIHGWEEVGLTKAPDGTYHPNPEFARGNVVPYIWNNLFDNADLGYRMANAGYPVILCNVTNFYFDLANDNDPEEPGLYWGGFVNTRNAWTFAPFDFFKTTYKTNMGSPIDTDREFKNMVRLRPAARRNIIGLQAQLWGETVRGNEMLEYHLLPKLLGFAERAWGAERPWENIRDVAIREELIRNEWNIFANTLAVKELPRLSFIYGGYIYRLPLPGAMVEEGFLKANVEFPGLIIRYTTDGAEPDGLSPVYDDPVPFTGTVRLKSFDAAGRSSRTSILE